MTRTQWYAQHRANRVKRNEAFKESTSPTRYTLTSCAMVRALRSIYNYHYLPHQSATIHLLARYKSKLPRTTILRITKQIHSWMPAARRRGKEYMNPFFALIPKGDKDAFAGKYIPVPLEYGPPYTQQHDYLVPLTLPEQEQEDND